MLVATFSGVCLFGFQPGIAGELRRFYGQIVDENTREPISNVRIKLFNLDEVIDTISKKPGGPHLENKFTFRLDPIAATISDARGNFVLETTTIGKCDIVCDRPGRKEGLSVKNLPANKPLMILYKVGPKSSSTSVSTPSPKQRDVDSEHR